MEDDFDQDDFCQEEDDIDVDPTFCQLKIECLQCSLHFIVLEHAAAVAALGDANEWDQLLDAGLVRQASMTTTDDTGCRVIYLPPACLVQF